MVIPLTASVNRPDVIDGAVRISLACWDYDRTRGVLEGRIRPEGLTVDYIVLPPEETFFRMARFGEFDVSELSLSSYVISRRSAEPPFIAVPVFPSRAFRHSGIYVRRKDGIEKPEQLSGRRVGVAEYQLTANVWIRGILAEHHGLPFRDVTYVTGGLEDPGRIEKLELDLPDSIRVEPAPGGTTLAELLSKGEIDAIYSPRPPSTLASDGARHLFEDFPAHERAYFERTKIFPIMHVLAIRTDVYRRNRWMARSLFKAFSAARDEAIEALSELAALKVSLPWAPAHAEDARRLMGEDFWSYGVQSNRHVLAKFLEYAEDQGLAGADQTVDSLFAPETLEEFAI
jgi:4,5-dihydroxyphthalate decarboxylase